MQAVCVLLCGTDSNSNDTANGALVSASQIMLSLAIYCKIQLCAYGGYGFGYLQRVICPALQQLLTVRRNSHATNTAVVHKNTVEEQLRMLVGANMYAFLNWRPAPVLAEKVIDYLQCHICNAKFVPGSHFSKFQFVYCTSKCLGVHRTANWK